MSAVPRAVADGVDMRDSYRCVRCGVFLSNNGSRHHRIRRAVGGHSYANIILLCGSGTTGCHSWAHANPDKARREGLIIDANRRPPIDPAEVPIKTHTDGWVLLTNEGQREPVIEAIALELLAAFGLLRGNT